MVQEKDRFQAGIFFSSEKKVIIWGNSNGEKFYKNIRPTDLIAMIKEHSEEEKFETPLPMPKGAFYYAQIGNTYKIAIIKSKVMLEYNLHGQIITDVGMPNLLFVFEVQDQKISNSRVACLKSTEQITDDTELYNYPFSNVYSDYYGRNSNICWGGTIMPFVKKAGDLDKVVRLFLTMEKNYDLYQKQNNAEGLEYRQLLKRVTGSEFDDELLVKSVRNVRQFIDN